MLIKDKLDTIRITVPCYITNHESDQELILGNLFLNKLEDYSIGKNGIEIIYKGETCFIKDLELSYKYASYPYETLKFSRFALATAVFGYFVTVPP